MLPFGLDEVFGILQLYLCLSYLGYITVPACNSGIDLGDERSIKGFQTKLKSPQTIQWPYNNRTMTVAKNIGPS